MAWPKYNRSKFGNKRTQVFGGISFSSKLEGDVYRMLVLMEKAGEISEIRTQPNVELTRAKIKMIPDFSVIHRDNGLRFVEAKGIETDTYRVKRKLWTVYGPAPLEVWVRSGKDGLALKEVIIPKASK